MIAAHVCSFSELVQFLLSILPNRLEQAIPCFPTPLRHGDKRFIYQMREQIKHLVLLETVACADGLGSFQSETTQKDRKPPEQDSFLLWKEVITPLNGRLQGLLPGQSSPAAAS